MWLFLKRLIGKSPEHEEANRRYLEAAEKLRNREKELEDLAQQFKGVSIDQEAKRKDFSETLKSMSPPKMQRVSEEKEDDRPLGKTTPTIG
jgi:hypothetical protein